MHEREKLRPTVDEDKDDFIHLVAQTMESIIKNTIPGAASQMVETYWKTPKVSCTIVGSATEHSAVTTTFALRSRGVLRLVLSPSNPAATGGSAPSPCVCFFREEVGKHGVDWYRAVALGDNGASASMMRKLNATPDGLRLAPWFDADFAALLEHRLIESVADSMRETAAWFGVDSA